MCVCGQAICRIRLPKIYVGISTRVQKSIVVFFFFALLLFEIITNGSVPLLLSLTISSRLVRNLSRIFSKKNSITDVCSFNSDLVISSSRLILVLQNFGHSRFTILCLQESLNRIISNLQVKIGRFPLRYSRRCCENPRVLRAKSQTNTAGQEKKSIIKKSDSVRFDYLNKSNKK